MKLANSLMLLLFATLLVGCESGNGNGDGEEKISTDIASSALQLESSDAGTATFRITSNMDWMISRESGWVSFSPADGTGDADITMTFTENTASEPRSVRFTVTGIGSAGNIPLTYTVLQPAFGEEVGEYYIIAEPDEITGIPYQGLLNQAVSVIANVSWSATTADSWITINGGSGTGNGTVLYSVTLNGGEARMGAITLKCTDTSLGVPDVVISVAQNKFVSDGGGGGGSMPYSWLELPRVTETGDLHFSTLYAPIKGNSHARNYSMLYDYKEKIAYWVAYPMHPVYLDGSGRGSWDYNPDVPTQYQVSGYESGYSKGHQIPSGDRHTPAGDLLNEQTFYYTNITPQLQNGFNGTIWNNMENAVRNWTKSSNDTLYVVTGSVLNKVGENKTVERENQHNVVIPNYYYKVMLKKKSGSSTEYTAIGFWFEHRNYSETKPSQSYAQTVDQIEEWTGFDFFANLPEDVQGRIESVKETSEWPL